jgi:hypothetical protein
MLCTYSIVNLLQKGQMDVGIHLTERRLPLCRRKAEGHGRKGGRCAFCMMSGTVSDNRAAASVILVTAKCKKVCTARKAVYPANIKQMDSAMFSVGHSYAAVL